MAWLWLSGVVETDEECQICLENVLVINPENISARRGLESLARKVGIHPLKTAASPSPEVRLSQTRPASPSVEGTSMDIRAQPHTEAIANVPPSAKGTKRKNVSIWQWLLAGGSAVVILSLIGCLLAYLFGFVQLPGVPATGLVRLNAPATANPTLSPIPELVKRVLPLDYKYVSDYITTGGGDRVWVVEVAEPSDPMTLGQFAVFFREFASTVDTTDVAWLKLSIVSSEAWMPYAYCVRSGPARAAANGDITDEDLFMQFDRCP